MICKRLQQLIPGQVTDRQGNTRGDEQQQKISFGEQRRQALGERRGGRETIELFLKLSRLQRILYPMLRTSKRAHFECALKRGNLKVATPPRKPLRGKWPLPGNAGVWKIVERGLLK